MVSAFPTYCITCGARVDAGARFCATCGSAVLPLPEALSSASPETVPPELASSESAFRVGPPARTRPPARPVARPVSGPVTPGLSLGLVGGVAAAGVAVVLLVVWLVGGRAEPAAVPATDRLPGRSAATGDGRPEPPGGEMAAGAGEEVVFDETPPAVPDAGMPDDGTPDDGVPDESAPDEWDVPPPGTTEPAEPPPAAVPPRPEPTPRESSPTPPPTTRAEEEPPADDLVWDAYLAARRRAENPGGKNPAQVRAAFCAAADRALRDGQGRNVGAITADRRRMGC